MGKEFFKFCRHFNTCHENQALNFIVKRVGAHVLLNSSLENLNLTLNIIPYHQLSPRSFYFFFINFII